jgi:succinate-semialdehyde dehydrogenase/glutarate-semialdehyde dehydrogenase
MARFFIGGEFVSADGRTVLEVHDPATGEVIDTVPQATGIAEAEEELAHSLTSEQGKPLSEARMEIRRFVHTLRHYAGLAKNLRGSYIPNLDEGTHGLVLKRPYGVCAAIVPWNFPISLMGNKIAPALVTGNTVVVKPASTTPLTAIRCIELLTEAGLPPGSLNIVVGPGSSVGQALVTHPLVRKIGFTGATDTGRQVMTSAAQGIKPVTLELGGSDPMIVCDDADLDRAVSAASVGRFFNCGQACLAIKRLYLFETIADEFVEQLLAKVSKLTIGNGLEEGVRIGPLHSEGQRAEVASQVADAVERGGEVLIGGEAPQGSEYDDGNFYLPTLGLRTRAPHLPGAGPGPGDRACQRFDLWSRFFHLDPRSGPCQPRCGATGGRLHLDQHGAEDLRRTPDGRFQTERPG